MRKALLQAAIYAAIISLAPFGSIAQSTTGNTGVQPNNTRNIPGNADTAKTAVTTGDSSSRKTEVTAPDRKFMETVAQHGVAEVEMGKLAQEKGSSQGVKDFGARMAKDHAKAGDELKQLASSKGLQLPSDMDKDHKAKMDRMQKLSGAAFDKAYMADMVADHKKDVSEFRKQSKNAQDRDLRDWASKTLPTLEEHLHLAQSTDQSVRTASK